MESPEYLLWGSFHGALPGCAVGAGPGSGKVMRSLNLSSRASCVATLELPQHKGGPHICWVSKAGAGLLESWSSVSPAVPMGTVGLPPHSKVQGVCWRGSLLLATLSCWLLTN